MRPAPIRSPGKPVQLLRGRKFCGRAAAPTGADPVEFPAAWIIDPRAIRVIRRTARLMNWQPPLNQGVGAKTWRRARRGILTSSTLQAQRNLCGDGDGGRGRPGQWTDRGRTSRLCAHDCGQISNPDGVRAQVEGSILQTMKPGADGRGNVRSLPRRERGLGELSDLAVLSGAEDRH